MSDQTIIALDIGRSAVKAIAFANGKRTEALIPSIVIPATSLSDEGQAKAAEVNTVEVDGRAYWVGETAMLFDEAQTTVGLSDDWIDSGVEYRALVLAALKRFAKEGVPGLTSYPYIIVGTPAQHYEVQRIRHEEVTGKTVHGEIKAVSQPLGAYCSYYLDERGAPIRNRLLRSEDPRDLRTWGVIEIGHYTTDFVLIKQGQNIPGKATSCKGLSMAADKLRAILTKKGFSNANLLNCTNALQTGRMRRRGEDVSVRNEVDEALSHLRTQIKQVAKSTYADVIDELDGILLAGGGASMFLGMLEAEFHKVVLLPNPRMAVAEGYLRYARLQQQRRSEKAPKLMVEANG